MTIGECEKAMRVKIEAAINQFQLDTGIKIKTINVFHIDGTFYTTIDHKARDETF